MWNAWSLNHMGTFKFEGSMLYPSINKIIPTGLPSRNIQEELN